jgi:hypothetical protein
MHQFRDFARPVNRRLCELSEAVSRAVEKARTTRRSGIRVIVPSTAQRNTSSDQQDRDGNAPYQAPERISDTGCNGYRLKGILLCSLLQPFEYAILLGLHVILHIVLYRARRHSFLQGVYRIRQCLSVSHSVSFELTKRPRLPISLEHFVFTSSDKYEVALIV